MHPLSGPDAEQASNVIDFLSYKRRRSTLSDDPVAVALVALAETVAVRYGIGRVEKMLGKFCDEDPVIRDAIVHRLARYYS